MKTNKLISSMAISLTTVFVLLGTTIFFTYQAIGLLGSIGTVPFSFYMLANLLPMLIALLTIFIIIFGFVGAHKAKNNPTKKGVFVTMAIFQMLALLCMLFVGGYYIYFIVGLGGGVPALLVEGCVYAVPYVLGGIALFVAFIKNCAGMKKAQTENQGYANEARPVPPPPPVPPMYNNQ